MKLQQKKTIRKKKEVMEEKRTRRKSLTRWSDSHVLLAVHDEAPHRLAIWIVGSSLTYCGRRRRQREGGEGVVN